MSHFVQQTGYQSRNRLSPAALGGVILVHAGLGAAILSMTVVGMPSIIDHGLVTWNIPMTPPPPPPEKAPPPRPRTHARTIAATDMSNIRIAKPVTDTVFPPFGEDGGDGADKGPIIDPGPPPEIAQPVITQAKPDTRFAAGFQPPYPAAMLRQQMEGAVTVRVTIAPDGRVLDVALVRAADPAFFEATRRQALSRWRFLPATRDGLPVTSEREMTVHFRLTD